MVLESSVIVKQEKMMVIMGASSSFKAKPNSLGSDTPKKLHRLVMKEDSESGSYNPLLLRYKAENGKLKPEDKARVAASLDASVRTMAAAFELADFGCWTGIIESVVYEGLYAVGGAVLQGTYQKSKRYTERQRKGRTQ